MTPLQTVELRQSEIRSRLSQLSAVENPDLEQRGELDTLSTEFQSNESRLRALIITDDNHQRIETPTEDHQLKQLELRASVGEIFDSLRSGRAVTGATAELQQELRMDKGMIPLSLITGPLETRAAASITGDVQINQQPVVRAVFPGSVSDFLYIDQPTVAVGDSSYPVITTSATVHTPAAGAAAAESTGAFTVKTIEPSRVQASFRWRREDAMRFMELESSLRDNLAEAIMSALDGENLNDAVNGLLGTSGLTERSGDAGAVATFATYRGLLYDSLTIDGSFASMASEVRVLFGPASYAHAASVYRGNSADDSGIDSLMNKSGGVMTSGHVPDPSSNDQAVIVRKGMRRDMVNPLWMGIETIFDDVTAAGDGEIIITAVLLSGRSLLRANGFQRRAVQVA